MSMTLSLTKSFTIGSKTFGEQRSISGGEAIVREQTVNAAISGTVAAAMTSTTTTTTTLPPGGTQTGTLNLSSVSGLVIGNRLDVYWSGGSLYGATIEDIAGTAIVFSGGTLWSAGTALPGNGTAITCMVPTSLPFSFTGNNLQAVVQYGDQGGTFILDTATPSNAYPIVLPTPATSNGWFTGGPTVNPTAGVTITQLLISHGALQSATMRVGAIVNP